MNPQELSSFRQHGADLFEIVGGLSRADARAVEQVLIEKWGLQKNGGRLVNKINSIADSNPAYRDALKRGQEILRIIGYVEPL